MRRKFTQIILIFLVAMILASCAIFHRKCPIPNCKTRKYHQHALVFDLKDLRKQARKKKINKTKKFFGIKSKAMDSTDVALADTVSIETSKEEEKKHNDFSEEEDEIGSKKTKEVDKPKVVTKNKESKSSEEIEAGEEDATIEENGETKKPKRKFRWPWQKSDEQRYLEEQQEVLNEGNEDTALEEVNGIDEEDFAREWRSRRWHFWGNQNPKVGQRWKAPTKK